MESLRCRRQIGNPSTEAPASSRRGVDTGHRIASSIGAVGLGDLGDREVLKGPVDITPEEFEREALLALRAGCADDAEIISFEQRRHVKGPGGEFEIDGVVRIRWFGGAEMVVLVECKRHRRRIERNDVLAFEAKMRDCGAHKGIFIASGGFQSGAIEFAESRRIATATITDGRLNYETFGLGPAPPPPPHVGAPEWETFLHAVSDQGGTLWTLVNRGHSDALREWLSADL